MVAQTLPATYPVEGSEGSDACGDRRCCRVELAHKIDGVHAHMRVGTEHVQGQIATALRLLCRKLLEVFHWTNALEVLHPAQPYWLAPAQ
eukprot:5917424-Prymnesium_polylepis.2